MNQIKVIIKQSHTYVYQKIWLTTLLVTSITYIPYMAKHVRGKLPHFEWKMVIHGKTATYIMLIDLYCQSAGP